MTLELILFGATGAIAFVLLLAVLSVGRELVRSRHARVELVAAVTTGAQPPSLHPRIDLTRCLGSGSCVTACPEADVLAVIDGQAHVINPTSCIGHGECLRACPVDAITLVLGSDRRGVDIPLVDKHFQTDVEGLYVVGELGGMGLIYNATTQALQCLAALVPQIPPKVEGIHQLVIVGAGPAGIAASLAAMEAGLDFVTLDQDSLGGTVLQYPRHKLVMTRPVTLPLYGRIEARELQKEQLLEIWRDLVAKTGLTIRGNTRVERVQRDESGIFTVQLAGGEALRSHRVVLAMGRRGTPQKLGVPGEALEKVVYRLIDPERYEGTAVLVVGGGDSALEAAVALVEVGARVTLSYRKGDFSRAKKKNRARVEAKIDAEMITFIPRSTVRSIEPTTVVLAVDGEEREISNDYVLVFAGGLLPTRFLGEAGVTIERFSGQAYAPANPGMAADVLPEREAAARPRRFTFHECLGRGGFGEVYRATAIEPSGETREVAIKILRRDVDPNGESVVRLRDEARLLIQLDHPAILQARDLVVVDGRVALVMEYVDGLNLAQLIQRAQPPERAAVEIVAAVAGALHAAWTTPGPSGAPLRLIHRDVKPGNVQISRTGEVKLLDFGVARADIDREASTDTGMVLGTYQYMAPESFQGRAGAPADVFALGCMLFHVLAGRRYIRTASLPEQYGVMMNRERYESTRQAELASLSDRAHPLTVNLVGRALSYEPSERPRTEDLVTMFGQLLGRLPGDPLREWLSALEIDLPTTKGDLTSETRAQDRALEVTAKSLETSGS